MSWRKRIKRLEDQVHPPPDPETLEAERLAHREAIAHLERRCEEDEDPTNRRAAVADLREYLRAQGRY